LPRIFLDTLILSHNSLGQLTAKLVDRVESGDEFLVSALTHFEILGATKRPDSFVFVRYVRIHTVPYDLFDLLR
jgi:hypothetical protein